MSPFRGPQAIEHIRTFTSALADVADTADLGAAVPSCPEWTLGDLVWHLTEVQHFWAHTVGIRPTHPREYEEPERVADDRLVPELRATLDRFCDLLADADPDDEAWTWSEEQSVGFTMRRQLHEALIHYCDGLLAVGAELPAVDPAIAADGLDEVVTLFLGRFPDWGEFERTSGVVEVRATDAPKRWRLAFGRWQGTSPTTGTVYDEPAVTLVKSPTNAVVSATAWELDLWLWGRSDGDTIVVNGDGAMAHQLREVAALDTE